MFTEIFAQYPDVESVVTTTLTAEGDKTRMRVVVRYPSQEVRDIVMKSGMEHGARASYDRFEDLLARLGAPVSPGDRRAARA